MHVFTSIHSVYQVEFDKKKRNSLEGGHANNHSEETISLYVGAIIAVEQF